MQVALGMFVSMIYYCVSFFIFFKHKMKIKDSLILFAVVTFFGWLLWLFFPFSFIGGIAFNSILVAVFFCTAYKQLKNIPVSMLFAVLSIVVVLVSAGITEGIFMLFNLAALERSSLYNDLATHIASMTVTFVFLLIIGRLTSHFVHKTLSGLTEPLQKKISVYMLCSAIIILAMLYVNAFILVIIENIVLHVTVIYILVIVSVVFLMFTTFSFTSNLRKEITLAHQNERMENLQSYMDNLEIIQTELRGFRHDHVNLLLGFGGYIENGDIESIRNYYMKYITPFTGSLFTANASLDRLGNIKISEIKSIVSLKLIHAQHQGVQVETEADDVIENVPFDLIDFCRITGILLDNALEACHGLEKPVIKYTAFKKDKTWVFLFMNSCIEPPPIAKIFDKGFSTKQKKRGLGLFTAKKILERHDNVSINTFMEDGFFVQELIIQPKFP